MKITVCFEDLTEESSEYGCFYETGVVEEHTISTVEDAVSYLADRGPFEVSCSHWKFNAEYAWLATTTPFSPRYRYSTGVPVKHGEIDRYYTYHLNDFTNDQKIEVFKSLKARKLL